MIVITLNGRAREVAPGQSLADLICQLGATPPALATGVNGVFVAREARPGHILKEGDTVLTFEPITGG